MLAITRKNEIKDIILDKKSITVTELSKRFSVTEETIRRDLKQLEEEGVLIRTYGGAFIQDGVENNVDLNLRKSAYVQSKASIARCSKQFIHNGDSLFIDSSTTSLALAKEISDMRLTVMTNSLLIINELHDKPNIRLIAIGGNYSSVDQAFGGLNSNLTLQKYYLDKAFVSCRTLSLENGITDSIESIAEIRQIAIRRSKEIYVIADYSKFNHTSFVHICDYDDVDYIVSDYEPTDEWLTLFQKHNVRYCHAKES
ncbi:MAG: DeoR/GlpR family DNA-binding transcription regulator [Lachnospiraceae bacterium]|nr:DeoR/GlpR family DNA-binding transcription regulator [Lachnospiraceae bacterium]